MKLTIADREHFQDKGYFLKVSSVQKELVAKARFEIESKIDYWRESGDYGIENISYKELSQALSPRIKIRSGIDEGMIDVFHADKLGLDGLDSLIRTSKPAIEESIFSLNRQIRLTNINLYLNKSESGIPTRQMHFDCFQQKIKVFIYLTDVNSSDDGPYAYVSGSHRWFFRRYTQFIKNKITSKRWSDFNLFSIKDQTSLFTAPAGTVIYSDQRGLHCGLPQVPGHQRFVLVFNFE
ncbi:MAG: hypothetical protein AB8E15_12485 [Bdellovibrionales bacterium]